MTPQLGDKVVQGVACPKCEGRLCVFCDDIGLVPSDSDEGLVIAVLDDGFVRVWWMMRRQFSSTTLKRIPYVENDIKRGSWYTKRSHV